MQSYAKHKHLITAELKRQTKTACRLTPVASAVQIGILSFGLGFGLDIDDTFAATMIVNSNSVSFAVTNGTQKCTLQNAITTLQTQILQPGCGGFANNDPFGTNDTILFYGSNILGGDTITLTDQFIAFSGGGSLTVDGGNVGSNGLTIDGADTTDKVLYVINGSNLILKNTTITGGSSTSTGGGISVKSSSLSLSNSVVSGNSSGPGGGGITGFEASISLSNSEVSDNSGRGIKISGTGNTLTLNDSSVSGNVESNSGNGAGGDGGGISFDEGILTLNGSTISGNFASDQGGGIFSRSSTISVLNSTISGNSVAMGGKGGGISVYRGTSVSLLNVTVSDNSASYGAGVNFERSTTIIENSIIANSFGGDDCRVYIPVSTTSDSNSIIEDGSCALNARNIDPKLASLVNNGGETLTHALISSSPAIKTGNLLTCLSTDQTGKLRTDDDGKCDVGAFESTIDEDNVFVIPIKNGKTVIFGL